MRAWERCQVVCWALNLFFHHAGLKYSLLSSPNCEGGQFHSGSVEKNHFLWYYKSTLSSLNDPVLGGPLNLAVVFKECSRVCIVQVQHVKSVPVHVALGSCVSL